MRNDLRAAFDSSASLKNWRISMPSYEEMESVLHDGEEVHVVVKTCINREHVGVAILTNRHIHLLGRGILKGSGYNETTSLGHITGMSRKRELAYLGWTISVSRASNVDNLLGVDKHDSELFVSAANKLIGSFAPAGQPVVVNQAIDPLDQLKKLKELLDAGVISQIEFDAKKQSLMDRI